MMTGFQFKAALAVSRLKANELAKLIGLHQATILRYARTSNFEYLNCHSENSFTLELFFKNRGIIFLSDNSIKLSESHLIKNYDGITRFHLVVARIATGLSQNEFSKHIKISYGSLSILERLENYEFITNRKINITSLKTFFSHLGILLNDNFTVTLKKDPTIFFKR